MNDYFQPTFYRFNEDSLKLIQFVINRNKSARDVLDLGCGSGIIGIEVSNALNPTSLYLLEGQDEWSEFLKKNVDTFLKKEVLTTIAFETFGKTKINKKFDLIVCNPPYYLPGHGESSLNKLRDNSRTFNIDNWKVLLDLISSTMSDSAKAYIVTKDDLRIIKEITKYSNAFDVTQVKKDGLVFWELLRLNKN